MLRSSSCGFSNQHLLMDEKANLYGWGDNSYNQLGLKDKKFMDKPTFIQNNPNICNLIVGVNNCFYLEKNGDLYAAGWNSTHQTGLPDKNNIEKFTKVKSNVKMVSSSYEVSVLINKKGDAYFCGSFGGLKREKFEKISGLSDIKTFALGFSHSIFIKKNGEIYVLGKNEYGQLGNQDFEIEKQVPHLLMIDKNAFSVSCGYSHTFILTRNEEGTILKCFGYNINGQLGTLHYLKEPINTINHIKDVRSVHCGSHFTLLLTDGGDVYSAGANNYHQLGITESKLDVKEFTKTNLSGIVNITTGWDNSLFINRKRELFTIGRIGIRDHSPSYGLKKVDFNGTIKLIQNQLNYMEWNTDDHIFFDEEFKGKVLLFLLCSRFMTNETKKTKLIIKLPRPIVYIIIRLFSLL
eukprot:TRINITY_DN547_c0_g3_i1.p1 TRINITY_DN547_c0_g3~~TRINITY_DN547_c0_g3_i1.p1  ORF type:complete len:408 (+),score=88.73 TRINITY_DN547_c0_g3_i1:75-1298(+)